jgi:hypothetical protein
MEGPYSTPQIMSQSPFFYYNPDPKPDHRQHGHFTPHPNGSSTNNQFHHFQHQMQGNEQSMPLPSSVIYSRPSSASSHSQFKSQAPVQSAMTPMASPQPHCQKPTVLIQDNTPHLLPLDTGCAASDVYFFPSTPPLSTSGSSISSPPSSCGVLPTPVNGNGNMFGLEIFEGVKEGCEGEVQSENLAGGDWSRFGSPPMTPGEFLTRYFFFGVGLNFESDEILRWGCLLSVGVTDDRISVREPFGCGLAKLNLFVLRPSVCDSLSISLAVSFATSAILYIGYRV